MRLLVMAGNLKNQAMNSDLILVIQKVRNGVSVPLQKADIKTMADQGETSHIQCHSTENLTCLPTNKRTVSNVIR